MTEVPEEVALPDVGARLRRHRPDDLDALLAAVEESRDHLRPHMPWADEGRVELAAFITEAVAQWDTGHDRNFVIEDVASGALLGGCGLHARIGVDGLEIGYWLRAGRPSGLRDRGRRGADRPGAGRRWRVAVEIDCDEANVRSAAVARRLGYRLDRIEPDVPSAPGDLGRSMIWVRRSAPSAFDDGQAVVAEQDPVEQEELADPQGAERGHVGRQRDDGAQLG